MRTLLILLALCCASCTTTTPTRAADMVEAAGDAEQVAGQLESNPTVTRPAVEWLRAHAGTLRAWSKE